MTARFEPDILHPAVPSGLATPPISCEMLRCEPSFAVTAAFCEHHGYSPEQAANATIVLGNSNPLKYACCLVPATCELDANSKASGLIGVKRCSFASADETLELTGMEIGGVTPIGLPTGMTIYVDAEIPRRDKVVVGGGNRTSRIPLHPGEFQKIANVQVIEALGLVRSGFSPADYQGKPGPGAG